MTVQQILEPEFGLNDDQRLALLALIAEAVVNEGFTFDDLPLRG